MFQNCLIIIKNNIFNPLVILLVCKVSFLHASNNHIIKINDEVFVSDTIIKNYELISYTGHIKDETIEIKAKIGKKFVLIPFYFKKIKINQNKFDPNLIYLHINQRKYSRSKDTTILDDLELKWFPFIKINYGEHSGFLLYYINSITKIIKMDLIYNDNIINIKQITSIYNY
tara:strand:- start:185 stop:700 length:516 start_codon:yes stop_codon:yes gene_type:complete